LLDGDRVRIWQALPKDDNEGRTPGTILSADKTGLRVACGQHSLLILKAQLAGGKVLSIADLLNSKAALFAPGRCFTPTTDNQEA
jgi:methionyl-tRNA formyltransferase